ncbi:MAG TPA: hypothetical protein VN370_10800 [Desulfitobacteriaceae bacterium]|nr:hypothetical protein [Desulfitobacteriaceae bacterium]
MAIFNKTVYLPPQLISYEDTQYYLQINSSGCVLYNEYSLSPLYQLKEPLLLIQGMAASSQQIHLVMIKANGDLCYTLVNGPEKNQTTVLAKLDVRSTRYRRLLLFPLGKTIHIFYAYAHQAIPDLWRIEHRFWNGKTWRSVNLGEVVHQREPLYDVVLDQGGNLHLLMVTFQGRQTAILTNRFNGSFHLWGNTLQAFQIPQQIIDITSIITPDNNHHLFWLAKTPSVKFELGWAYQTNVQDIAGKWIKAPATLQTLKGPVKGLGVLEVNGSLWLLVNAETETLLLYKGDGWKQILSNTPTHRHLRYVRKNNSSYYNTYWLEESHDSRTPAYHQYLGLNLPSMVTQAKQAPNQSPYINSPFAARTSPQTNSPLNPEPLDQSAYNTVQSPVVMSISRQAPQKPDSAETRLQNPSDQNTSPVSGSLSANGPDPDSSGQSTCDLPQIEPAEQQPLNYNLQLAYTNYPDELIPPTPEISSAAPPNFLPANIDQPVFAAQPPGESVLEDNPDSTTLPDSLPVFAPAKVSFPETEILTDNTGKLNEVLAPVINAILEPFRKTIEELEGQVAKIQAEKEQTYQKFEQQLSESEEECKATLEKIENNLNQIDNQTESSLQKFEQQLSELQAERKATLERIENYLSQIDSQTESSLQKFEQQLSKLQLGEESNHQEIEQLIASIQIFREEAQKSQKGFWAKWFR